MKLAGRVALISGTGGGIGRAVSRAFVAAGAAVAGCDIDAAAAEETAFLAPKCRRAGNRPDLRRG